MILIIQMEMHNSFRFDGDVVVPRRIDVEVGVQAPFPLQPV